jgi:hypothetical protein
LLLNNLFLHLPAKRLEIIDPLFVILDHCRQSGRLIGVLVFFAGVSGDQNDHDEQYGQSQNDGNSFLSVKLRGKNEHIFHPVIMVSKAYSPLSGDMQDLNTPAQKQPGGRKKIRVNAQSAVSAVAVTNNTYMPGSEANKEKLK